MSPRSNIFENYPTSALIMCCGHGKINKSVGVPAAEGLGCVSQHSLSPRGLPRGSVWHVSKNSLPPGVGLAVILLYCTIIPITTSSPPSIQNSIRPLNLGDSLFLIHFKMYDKISISQYLRYIAIF